MATVVHEVEHEVVLHSDVESLHLLSLGAALANGSVNGVLSFHEVVVFGLNLVDDTGSVDAFFVALPVDLLVSFLDGLVVEVKHRLQLGVGLLGLTSG